MLFGVLFYIVSCAESVEIWEFMNQYLKNVLQHTKFYGDGGEDGECAHKQSVVCSVPRENCEAFEELDDLGGVLHTAHMGAEVGGTVDGEDAGSLVCGVAETSGVDGTGEMGIIRKSIDLLNSVESYTMRNEDVLVHLDGTPSVEEYQSYTYPSTSAYEPVNEDTDETSTEDPPAEESNAGKFLSAGDVPSVCSVLKMISFVKDALCVPYDSAASLFEGDSFDLDGTVPLDYYHLQSTPLFTRIIGTRMLQFYFFQNSSKQFSFGLVGMEKLRQYRNTFLYKGTIKPKERTHFYYTQHASNVAELRRMQANTHMIEMLLKQKKMIGFFNGIVEKIKLEIRILEEHIIMSRKMIEYRVGQLNAQTTLELLEALGALYRCTNRQKIAMQSLIQDIIYYEILIIYYRSTCEVIKSEIRKFSTVDKSMINRITCETRKTITDISVALQKHHSIYGNTPIGDKKKYVDIGVLLEDVHNSVAYLDTSIREIVESK